MRWIVRFSGTIGILLLAFSQTPASAIPVMVKNNGPAPVQLGFDRGPATTIAPRSTAAFSLDPGQHSAQCRFDGNYDGCNLEELFTLGDRKGFAIDLLPVFTLQHAVALAQQGTLGVETRRDGAWATNTLQISGAAADCANYETGRLAQVSTRVRSGMTIRNVSLTTQNLCGEMRPVVAATVNGAQLYFQPDFLWFRDQGGHLVLVRQ